MRRTFFGIASCNAWWASFQGMRMRCSVPVICRTRFRRSVFFPVRVLGGRDSGSCLVDSEPGWYSVLFGPRWDLSQTVPAAVSGARREQMHRRQ